MTMIVERGVLDIGNDSSTICGSSAHQLVRSEASNGDVELDKLLDYSDCESSDLLSSGRSPAASANNPTFRSDHVSQYHSIQKLCTPTSASTKSEEGQSKDQCHNSFNFPGVKVKTEMSGYQYFVSSEASEDKRETRSDDDDDDDQQQTGEVLPKRQRMGNPRDDCYIGPSDSQYRPKRKQPQPKHCDEGAAMRTQVSQSVPSRRSIVDSYNGAQTDLLEIKKSLSVFKKRHENIFTESSHKSEAKRNSFENDEDSENPEDDDCDSKLGQLEALTKMLKGEIYQNIELLVDHVVRKFVHKNYQQLNVALHHHKNFSINSDEEVHVHSDEIRQNNASEDSQNDPKFSEVHPFSEKPLNYSLQISGKKEEGSSGQESYKTYLRQLANSSCKTLYPLSSMQNMIPMFVPPFNAGYMFHSPNVYHSLLYHSSQKQQEVLKHDSSAALVSEPEQSEAIPLIVNSNSKKKRTKVTDSRFSPRIRFQLGESSEQSSLFYHSDSIQTCGQAEKRAPSYESKTFQRSHQASRSEEAGRRQIARDEKERDYYKSPFQAYMNSNPKFHDSDVFANIYKQNPSSVPICEDVQRGLGDKFPYQNEHLNKSVLCHIGSRSRSESDEEMNREDSMKLFKDSSRSRGLASSATETSYGDQLMHTSTLTPMHLRKAKLMFFYVRYPSSSVLKTYFPDVFFNKNNTAQLIKWFSNFREFYYIQMEKFARQAIAEGIVNVSSLYVNRDSELYRILVLHYNRNNRIEVPENFRVTVQATLREFFKAIQAERDQEQSWKKAIYKVIARLDDVIPEHFKRINWMEELADS